jgi:hypothetical protein
MVDGRPVIHHSGRPTTRVTSTRASIVQTMDTYSHLLEDIGGDAVGGLDEAFG